MKKIRLFFTSIFVLLIYNFKKDKSIVNKEEIKMTCSKIIIDTIGDKSISFIVNIERNSDKDYYLFSSGGGFEKINQGFGIVKDSQYIPLNSLGGREYFKLNKYNKEILTTADLFLYKIKDFSAYIKDIKLVYKYSPQEVQKIINDNPTIKVNQTLTKNLSVDMKNAKVIFMKKGDKTEDLFEIKTIKIMPKERWKKELKR